ncbi:LAQU0S21e00452g1_1 [Lachancea quebecensis]|uniref:LAQU0S21e00452g1_1 n=1 Tax=Lachancea quebecensis TaxID=1654605 RepID=A0A0P1KXN2_9SACH|nr:LAQU0S21e00452g1_1 [Lachancea quebecensis]
MSQGTLYVNSLARGYLPSALVKYLGLDITIVDTEKDTDSFLKQFPMGKIPAFVGPEGMKLTEVMAVAYYLVNLKGDEDIKKVLCGATLEEEAQIMRVLSFTNSELAVAFPTFALMLLGKLPYNKKICDEKRAAFDACMDVFEQRLTEYTYLATEEVSLADLFLGTLYAFSSILIFGAEYRAKYPAIARWFKTVIAHPALAGVFDLSKFRKDTLQYVAPKKESKKEAKKETKKPAAEKAKPAAEAEKPAEQPKKPKHPLELLGKASFPLDDWKRKYSNEDTRPVALPWFWEHYNPEEYSIWRVDFKYNDELTLCFMSNNQVGGFMERLTGSVKYMFGCMVVYGEDRNNGIVGAIMLRGQDHVPAFEVAPDWTSYDYAKLDPSKEEDKEFINNMWAWDKPVVINGEPREISDGKVLK